MSNMKKVVHISSAHPRYDQRILWRECCSLREHGYDVTLVVNDEQENEILENGISIISTGFRPNGRHQRMTEGVRRVYLLALALDADIYHLHDAELLLIALQLKRKGKKVIFDSHETYGEVIKGREWIPSVLRESISWSYNKFETYVCRRIDGVVYVGKYDGKDYFEGRAQRVVYVGNFPRLGEFEGVFIPPYQSRSGICYSGNISKDVGILNTLRAAEIANAKMMLAGKFESDEFRNMYFEQDNNRVTQYFGFLNRKELFAFYSKCAVGMCALPDDNGQRKKDNSFNTKVYEYMAMEMPVILSDWPYRRQMIEQYQFGVVVNPDDVDDISSKIRWLLDHPKEAETMGKNGKRLLMEQFTWEHAAEAELLRLYREIE